MADPNDEETRALSDDTAPEEAEQSSEPEQKKASKSDAGGPQEIRDRNRRIREEAAQKRKGKRESQQRRTAPARNLDTSEIVDDALARSTHVAGNFLKRHFATVQWLVLAAVVGGIGYQIYSYRHRLNAATATDQLSKGLLAENARIGEGQAAADRYTGLGDPRPVFSSEAARLKAADEAYGKSEAQGGPLAVFAALGKAGVLFDQGKYKEAQTEYEKVKQSALAAKDRDLRGRAIEGIGLSLEAQKQVDPALTAFRELANTDIPGFNSLGEYHQARLLITKGDREQATKLLKKAYDRVSNAGDKDKDKKAAAAPAAPRFLEHQIRALLATLDPTAVPKPESQLSQSEQLRRLQQQLQSAGNGKMDPKQLEELLSKLGASKSNGAPEAPNEEAPPAEAPTPAGSAP